MVIWFKCNEENLMVALDTDVKPSIGETIFIKDKEYYVKKVIWYLQEEPIQSGIVVHISVNVDK